MAATASLIPTLAALSPCLRQPETWPERFESGTPNAPGIAGLAEGIAEIQALGLDVIAAHERDLIALLTEGLSQLPGIIVYGPVEPHLCTGSLSFNVQNLDCSEIAYILDTGYSIAVRSGLHCAPAAHRTIGTFPNGTVRVSVGPYTTKEEIYTLIHAVSEILKFRRK